MRSPGPSWTGSSTSTTNGGSPPAASSCASACATTGVNSRSTISTLAPEWRSWNAIVAASSRVLIVLSTAPVIGTPKCASSIAGMFGSTTDTVSPSPTSRAASTDASRRARASICDQLWRSGPWMAAQRSGNTSAAHSTRLTGVSGTWLAAFRSRSWRYGFGWVGIGGDLLDGALRAGRTRHAPAPFDCRHMPVRERTPLLLTPATAKGGPPLCSCRCCAAPYPLSTPLEHIMSNVVHPLTAASRPEILEHLVALSPDDRRLRFGVPVTDEAIAGYVERLDFDRDAVFGVRDDAGALVGVT